MTITYLPDGYAILHQRELATGRRRLTLVRRNEATGDLRAAGIRWMWEICEPQPSQRLLQQAVQAERLSPELYLYLETNRLLWRRYELPERDEELGQFLFMLHPLLSRSQYPLVLLEKNYVILGVRETDGVSRYTVPHFGRLACYMGKDGYLQAGVLLASPQPWQEVPANPEPCPMPHLFRAMETGRLSRRLRRWLRRTPLLWTPVDALGERACIEDPPDDDEPYEGVCV
ncbi:MAG: hypothetical protein N2554_01150 [Fimbriimonadales bacterium]|nr:hypothetical protein [Fimbriimonadales bacterium]